MIVLLYRVMMVVDVVGVVVAQYFPPLPPCRCSQLSFSALSTKPFFPPLLRRNLPLLFPTLCHHCVRSPVSFPIEHRQRVRRLPKLFMESVHRMLYHPTHLRQIRSRFRRVRRPVPAPKPRRHCVLDFVPARAVAVRSLRGAELVRLEEVEPVDDERDWSEDAPLW